MLHSTIATATTTSALPNIADMSQAQLKMPKDKKSSWKHPLDDVSSAASKIKAKLRKAAGGLVHREKSWRLRELLGLHQVPWSILIRYHKDLTATERLSNRKGIMRKE